MVSEFTRRIDDYLFLLRDLSPRREMLATLLILAETMVVYIFAGTLLAEHEPPFTPLPILLVFAVLFIVRLVPHLLGTLRVWWPHYQFIMAVSIAVSMLLVIKIGAFPGEPILSTDWLTGALDALILRESETLRSVWLLVIFVSLAWWRGKMRAEPSLETSYTMLRLGIVWIAGGLVFTVFAAPENARIFDQIHTVVAGFIVFSLIAIAVARQPETGHTAAWNMNPVWLLILVLPIVLIAGISLTAVGILTRDTLELLLVALQPVFQAIRFLVQALILTIAVIAFLLIFPFLWILERQGFGPMEGFPEIDLTPGSGLAENGTPDTLLSVEDPARYLIVGVILLALIWFLVRFVFRRNREWEGASFQQSESLIDWSPEPSRLMGTLRKWVGQRIGRWRQSIGPVGDEWVETRRIRRIYRRFLSDNEDAGISRGPGETPAAYARRVAMIHEPHRHQVFLLTTKYNQARYSGIPATQSDADLAEQALDSFQKSEH